MLSQTLKSLEATANVVLAGPHTSVAEAVASMLERAVGAVLVVDQGTLVGIFTEHDVVSRMVAVGRDPQAVEIGEVMTRDPLTADPDWTLGHALVVMHKQAIRHLPVVENGKPVGLVCARDALDPGLEQFIAEVRRRESFS